MSLYEKIGEFKPDSLIASNEFPILKEGLGLAAGSGELKRGALIVKGSDKKYYPAGKAVNDVTMKVFGILTDNVDTGSDTAASNIPAICYITGVFNKDAISLADGTIEDYTDDLKGIGIHLRSILEQ